VSDLILHLSILQSPVFLLNSRLSHFSAIQLLGRPFSLSYRTNLPSSLAAIHSSPLEFSSQLPVSVCGTALYKLTLATFLDSMVTYSINPAEAFLYYWVRQV
jgi:hypothetical protein